MAPESVSVPAPALVREPVPEITPERELVPLLVMLMAPVFTAMAAVLVICPPVMVSAESAVLPPTIPPKLTLPPPALMVRP